MDKDYQDALERARVIKESIIKSHNEESAKFYVGFINNIFPELMESEDERIINFLYCELTILCAKECNEGGNGSDRYNTLVAAMDWLEKQKEQKPISQEDFDTAKHEALWGEQKPRKFKLGDKVHWYDDNTNVSTITGFRDDAYLTDSAYGLILYCDEDYWERVEQKPAEWSKEDEDNIRAICSYLDSYIRTHEKDGYGVEECKYRKSWLKSLRPQPHWKPSDEQMEALFTASTVGAPTYRNSLKSLYNDLKKLM